MKRIIRYPLESCELKAINLFILSEKKAIIYLLYFLAQGSSSLVYRGQYKGKPCIIKELFPEGLAEKKVLIRRKNGKISVNISIKNSVFWNREKRRFKNAVKINFALQKSPKLLAQITHYCGLYKTNGTFYVISDTTEGRAWNTYTGESVKRIIGIGSLIAQMTEEVHEAGWLVVDIKASNYIIIEQNAELPRVKLVDFDSMISHQLMNKSQQYRCSSETAPPELLWGIHQNVGFHSDVYSIAAMLFYKLTQKQVTEEWAQVYALWEKEKLDNWKTVHKRQLKEVMEKALERDVRKRIKSCCELAEALENIMKGSPYENL